jgi:hypothetical protein
MTSSLNIATLTGDDSFDLLFDQGLSNRLTLIVGRDAQERSQALNNWLDRSDFDSLRINCTSDEEREACPQRIFDAFASAGIIKPSQDTAQTEECNQSRFIALLNELAARPRDLVVALFNYNPCEQADWMISFLLEHLPQQIHIYMSSDDVPDINCIPRLRVRRQFQMIDTNAR